MIPKLLTIKTAYHQKINGCESISFCEFIPSTPGYIQIVECSYYLFDRDIVRSMLVFHTEDQGDAVCLSEVRI